MVPEKTFQQLLGLNESWEVSGVEFNVAEDGFIITVKETDKLWAEESQRLGQKVICYDHVEPMRWRHLNVFNKEAVIACALPRGREAEGKVYRVTPPWEGKSKHFTKEFEAFALTLIREMPVKKAGEILGETDQRLWRMVIAQVKAAYAQLSLEDLVWVGADEMNRRKGHNYLTVFADLVKKRVIFATPGKDASVWQTFVEELVKHNGHAKSITQAAIDMSPAYAKGVTENLGNAQIVFDKFHVISQVNEGVSQVRRLESPGQSLLRKTQWIWRKNPENWTEKEALSMVDLEKANLMTATAYQMRLTLQGVYGMKTEKKARAGFKQWCHWVKQKAGKRGHELLEPMVKVAQMIESHLEGILAHWKAGLTTAYLEGLNSLFSATKRKARGYKSTQYLITMLYFVAGKLNLPSAIH